MANVHGGNLHHIYADTEILSARAGIALMHVHWSWGGRWICHLSLN
jgi:hypothetical protein